MASRSIGIDLIKAIAITLIVLIHLSQFIDDPMLSSVSMYIIIIGVGLFVFASGFLLQSHYPKVEGWRGFKSFFGKRIFRLFPLYWMVLIFAFIATPILFSPKISIVAYMTGTQIFTGKFLELNVFWFVGLILAYYALYPILAINVHRPMIFGAVAIALIIPFTIVTYFTGLIDIRFFMYYPLFVSGIAISCFREIISPLGSKIGIFGLFTSFMVSALILPSFIFGSSVGSVKFIIFIGIMTVMTVSTGLFIFLIGERLDKNSTFTRLISSLSQCSYAIYLMHMSILILISQALIAIHLSGALYILVMIVTAFLCAIVGYLIDSASLIIKKTNDRQVHAKT